jgi:hypothetical protein
VPDIRLLRIYNFEGGQNDYASDRMVAENESPDCLNCRIDEAGMLQKRFKKTAYGGQVAGTAAAPVLAQVRGYNGSDGKEYNVAGGVRNDFSATQLSKALVYVQNGFIWRGNDATGGGNKLQGLGGIAQDWPVGACPAPRLACWAGDRVYAAFGSYYDTLCWALNTNLDSARACYKTWLGPFDIANGTDPDMTLSVGGAGAATTGYYCGAIAPGHGPSGSYGEGVVSARTAAYQHTNAAKKIKFTNMPGAGGKRIQQHRLYMTQAQYSSDLALVAPMYRVASLDSSYGAGYTNSEVSDADLQFGIPAPTTETTGNGATAYIRFLCTHNNRMWYVPDAFPDRLYYSNLNKPDEVPTLSYIPLKYQCTGIISFLGMLVVFTGPEIFTLRGFSPEDFGQNLESVIADRGCCAPDSLGIVTVQNTPMVFFGASDGLWGFDGSQCHFVGEKIQGSYANVDDFTSLVGIGLPGKYRLSYEDKRATGHTANNCILEYNASLNSWFPLDGLTARSFSHWHGSADAGECYFGDSTTGGKIWKMDTSGFEACDFHWQTKWFAPAGPEAVIQIKKVFVEADIDTFPIDVVVKVVGKTGFYKEYDFQIPKPTATVEDPLDPWDVMTWARTGTDTVEVGVPVTDSIIGTRVALKIESTDANEKKIVGATLAWFPRGKGRL